jgi:hypothetical protein
MGYSYTIQIINMEYKEGLANTKNLRVMAGHLLSTRWIPTRFTRWMKKDQLLILNNYFTNAVKSTRTIGASLTINMTMIINTTETKLVICEAFKKGA